MNKEDYRSLLLLVNDRDRYALLKEYAEKRINTLLFLISTDNDMDRVKRNQGAIAELRKFATLREEVKQGAK